MKKMDRRRGLTILIKADDSSENSTEIREQAKKQFNDLIPHRVDNNTVILIHANQDPSEQVNRFLTRLEKDRMNY